jgi:lipoprotein-releasing system permease protein
MNRTWLPFEWIAAIRFLLEGRMQSLFILAGVAIGVGVIVFMSALLTGLQANITRRILASQAHIVMSMPDEVARPLRQDEPGIQELATVQRPVQRLRSLDQWQAVLAMAARRPDITAVSPVAAGSALAVRGEASRAVTLTGIEPESWFRIVRLPDYIVAGRPRLGPEDVIIGTDLARLLGVTVGDRLRLSTGGGQAATLTVTALFDLGNRGVNERMAYVALRTAQALLDRVGGVTSLELTVADIYAAEDIAQELRRLTGAKAESWIATNQQFFTMVSAQRVSNTAIRLLVGLSVAFGIASVLVVSVVQRSREIGILRAMGARRGQVLRIFLIQGGVLGLLGSLVGSALGGWTLFYWHGRARNADGTELFPLLIDPWLFVAAAVLATLTGVAAAAVPALRAARLDPVEAIRG